MFGEEEKIGCSPAATPFVRHLTTVLAVILTVGSLAWVLDLYRVWFGLLLFDQQIVATLLGVTMALVYIHVPARGGDRGPEVPWYDWIAAVLGLGVGVYVAIRYKHLYNTLAYLPREGVIVSTLFILLVLEGLRRVAGKVLLIIILVFFAYAMFGKYLPGDLQARPLDYREMVLYTAMDVQGLLGPIVGIALTIVISFLLFGALLFRSGGSNFFTDISLALMGRYRGGSAKIAVTASSLFGMVSGSALANVVSTGVVTIPLMKKGGYKPEHAGAIEAVASTGGQLVPPVMGAAAFLMAEFLQITYAQVVIAAIIPSVLYYVALFIQADLQAGRSGITRVDPELIPKVRDVMRHGWHFPIPFAVLIAALFFWNMPPELAALWGSVALIAFGMTLGYRGKRMSWRGLATSITATGFTVIEIAMIASAAGIIIALLGVSGLGFALTLALVQLGGGNIFALLVVAAVISIVLGMGMPTLGVYVLLAALVAPSLAQVGVAPLAAHMFVLYFGMMSMVTPPVAIAAYGAATVAGAEPIKTCLAAMRFGWPAYIIPFLFALSPSLLFKGPLLIVAWNALTAIIGVWVATIGVVGYLTRPLKPTIRVVFFLAGFATLLPAGIFRGAVYTDVIGLAVAVTLIAREVIATRAPRAGRSVGPEDDKGGGNADPQSIRPTSG